MSERLLDPRALEVVRAVGVHGGVGAAAAVLHVTPSAVSQTIAALSHDVGQPVTRRVGRSIRLTPAGEALAAAAVDVGVALRRARAACDGLLTEPVGRVAVSAFASGARMFFPPLLAWARTMPGIDIELSDEDVATDQFAALTDVVDVVIGHRTETEGWADPEVTVVPLLREPLDVALPHDHRLADRTSLSPADLADEPWISVREGFPVAQVLASFAGGAHVTQRINDFAVVETLVASGAGIALLPRYTTATQGGIRLLPLRGVRAGRQIDALLRPDQAERVAVRRVVERLLAQARALTASPQVVG